MLSGPVIPEDEKQGVGRGGAMAPSVCPSAWASGPTGRGGRSGARGRDVEGQVAPELQAFSQPLKFIVATDSD